jgi:NADH:ubiquinone oxidoreductase subunit H
VKRNILLVIAVLAAACSKAPEPAGIRDVRPTSVEVGEKIILETNPATPLAAGEPVKVTFKGWWRNPGKPARVDQAWVTSGRATAPGGHAASTRVLVDADEIMQEATGGHAEFFGVIEVDGKGAGGKPLRLATGPGTRLDLFPSSVRKVAYSIAGDFAEDDLVEWLGVELEKTQDGKGLRVKYVRQAVNVIQLISDNDCGIWTDKHRICKAPLDGKLYLGELLERKPKAEHAHWTRLFGELTGDENPEPGDVLERTEAEFHEREDSPAAKAGLKEGDVIVAALLDETGRPASLRPDEAGAGFACEPATACAPVQSVAQLVNVWAREGAPDVKLGVLRPAEGGKTIAQAVSLPRYGKPASLPGWIWLAIALVVVGLLVILPVPLFGGLIVVWERKIAGRMQSRPGPNRVGPGGWLQFLADGIKLIVKEDITPTDADPYLFRVSPYLVFIGVFCTFVVIPVSQSMIVADLNVGILYLLSVTSLVVVGIIMGGWASNSKWSLLGGMRSAAQIISYELPASIAVLSVVMLAGTLSTQGLVLDQGGAPWNWHLFDNPFTFACFFIYFISALAEGNRTPFDLPEAESELVAGYNTEYSGFRFSIYFLAEWVNLIVIGSVATTVFLGGWRIPGVSPADIEASLGLQLASAAVFGVKVLILIFVIIWVRWTLPRFRVDQMMNMCWKYFLPISLVSLIAVSGWITIAPQGTLPRKIMSWAMFAVFGVGTLIWFTSRVLYARRTTKVLDLRGA